MDHAVGLLVAIERDHVPHREVHAAGHAAAAGEVVGVQPAEHEAQDVRRELLHVWGREGPEAWEEGTAACRACCAYFRRPGKNTCRPC